MTVVCVNQNGEQDNPWNLDADKAMDLVKAVCAAVLFSMLQDDVRKTGSFYQALQKHISSQDSQLQVRIGLLTCTTDNVSQDQHVQVLQKAQDWLADNDALNLLEMLLWSGYEDVREREWSYGGCIRANVIPRVVRLAYASEVMT